MIARSGRGLCNHPPRVLLCHRRVFRKETRSINDQGELSVSSEATLRSRIQFLCRFPAESFRLNAVQTVFVVD